MTTLFEMLFGMKNRDRLNDCPGCGKPDPKKKTEPGDKDKPEETAAPKKKDGK